VDWLAFLASLVGSLAWPTAILILAWWFRHELKPLLRRPIHRAKAGPVEVEWEHRVEQARIELAASPEAVEVSAAAVETGLRERLSPVADRSPRGAILEAFAAVEQTLRRTLEASGIRTDANRQSLRQLLEAAVASGAISEQTEHAIRGLIVLRNLAAHGSNDIDPAKAEEFIALADGVIYALEAAGRRRGTS
jgi:hypothetical protein